VLIKAFNGQRFQDFRSSAISPKSRPTANSVLTFDSQPQRSYHVEPNQSGLSDNAAGALAYVTIIPAIIFLIVDP